MDLGNLVESYNAWKLWKAWGLTIKGCFWKCSDHFWETWEIRKLQQTVSLKLQTGGIFCQTIGCLIPSTLCLPGMCHQQLGNWTVKQPCTGCGAVPGSRCRKHTMTWAVLFSTEWMVLEAVADSS